MTSTGPGSAPGRGSKPTPATIWGALLVVYVVWGSTYLAIRIVVEDIPPLLGMGMRFLAAGLLLAGIVAVRKGASALRVRPSGIAATATVGLLLLLGGNGGVAVAEQTVPSGLTALLISATPLWLVILRTTAGDRPRRLSLLGTLLGFLGIAILARPDSIDGDVETWGLLLVLAASASWAIGSFVSARLPMPADPFVATVWEMLLGGAGLVLAGSLNGDWGDFEPAQVSTRSWLWLAYLVLAGSIAAYSAYVWLLANAPLSLTATYAYVNPVVAVALGALILDEPITTSVLLGGAVVVVGVALVVSSERPRREQAPDETDRVTERV